MFDFKFFIVVMGAFILASCSNQSDIYSLYRSSTLGQIMRIHVATFDVAESTGRYNQENCQTAAALFVNQPGVTVRYWCEKGRFH